MNDVPNKPEPKRVKPWQTTVAVLLLSAFLIWQGWLALQPPPIRSKAVAGSNPTHYEMERGPMPGQLEEMKKAGLVPQDAIDDGLGHFVSPSRLTAQQLEHAHQVELRRAAWRARRGDAGRGGR
jgi:hypothetical protein